MDPFYKSAALILVTVILSLSLGKLEKDIALLLSITACCIAGMAAFHYLEPVFSFVSELSSLCGMGSDILNPLLKVLGILLLSEITETICTDAGNGSLAKMLHLISSGAILYLSLPIFQLLMNLLKDIMGEL